MNGVSKLGSGIRMEQTQGSILQMNQNEDRNMTQIHEPAGTNFSIDRREDVISMTYSPTTMG